MKNEKYFIKLWNYPDSSLYYELDETSFDVEIKNQTTIVIDYGEYPIYYKDRDKGFIVDLEFIKKHFQCKDQFELSRYIDWEIQHHNIVRIEE